MIDWLRREALEPVIELDGRAIPIALRRNRRAKRLTLRMAPDGSEVRITLPHWCRSAEAIAFAHARQSWLAAQLAKVPAPRDPAREALLAGRPRPARLLGPFEQQLTLVRGPGEGDER